MTTIPSSAAEIAAAQIPPAGELSLDHVAHFVPHMENAAPAFQTLGFALTPFSAQSHRLEPGGPLVPAGAGNRCVMLRRGYIECLTPTGDTQVANQLRAAIKRYVGVHLVAFGTAAPDLDHARLAKYGHAPLEPVALQRQVRTPQGEDTARFTVVRVPPGTMAEGRIQFCRHHTPEILWQPQWLAHANHAAALRAVILCVEDPVQTAARYARFTGLKATGAGNNWHIDTRYGRLLFAAPAVIKRCFNIEPPASPWIAGYVLASDAMAATRDIIVRSGFKHGDLDRQRMYVIPPPAIGGIIVFEEQDSAALELRVHAV